MEPHDYKSAFAREMAEKAGLADCIDFQVGDAVDLIAALPMEVDFVLVDLWKDLYLPCLQAFFPKLNPGAVIVADNMLKPPNEEVKAYRRAVRAKPGITSILRARDTRPTPGKRSDGTAYLMRDRTPKFLAA